MISGQCIVAALGLGLMGIIGCGNDDFASIPKLGNHLVWERAGAQLFASNQNNNKQLVMVTTESSQRLTQELQSDFRVRYVLTSANATQQHFLLEISNTDEWEHLAKLAHSPTDHGFACGNLEIVKPGLTVTDTVQTSYPPIYVENVALSAVKDSLTQVSSDNLKASIQTLQDLGSRYHTLGGPATATVQSMFQSAVGADSSYLKIQQIDHTSSTQKSLVASIPGTSDDKTVVIVGAHLDSINPSDLNVAPGADDDASGIATMVEAARIAAAAGWQFKRRVEFHAYAAEEVGLLGSTELAHTYATQAKAVAAMLQLDMNAYADNPEQQTIYLVSTDTYLNLRRSLKDLLNTYLGGNYAEMPLTRGTSDHKAWSNAGFPAVFPFEHPIAHNQALHTAKDTLTTINNLGLTKRFTQLTLAFLAHYAGLVAADADYTDHKANFLPSHKGLYFAVFDSKATPGAFDLAISGPTDVNAMEMCGIESAGAAGCNKDLLVLKNVGQKNERQVFLTTDAQKLADKDLWRVYGYDAQDHLVAERTVQLYKR